MNKQEYNGWTNYETWNVKLWMDNDEGSYRHWQYETQHCFDTNEEVEDAVIELADMLKDYFEENIPEAVSGVYADLLGAALSEVNWVEIAQSLIDEVSEEK